MLGWQGMPSCVPSGKREGAGAHATEHQGGERFENEEGMLQGIQFLLERRVCVLW